MKSLKVILRWLPAAFIVACSWYLSSQEKIESMPGFWNADKLVHCVCFAGLSFWVAFGVWVNLPAKWRIALPIAIVSAYGIVDEIHQYFTPGRSSSPFDWMADTLGAVIGSVVFFHVCKWVSARREKNISAE